MDTRFQAKLKLYQITLIFSILFSLLGFSYNVWRMEISEQNNTIRTASFEMLIELSSLEQLIYIAHYDGNVDQGNPRKGWVKVGLINDLSVLTAHDVEQQAKNLIEVWSNNWQNIDQNKTSVDKVVNSIDSVRSNIKRLLKSLE